MVTKNDTSSPSNMTTKNTNEASEMPRSPIRSMMLLEIYITHITTSHQLTTVVTNVPQSSGPTTTNYPISELWRPKMEESIPFATMPLQIFPLSNHQEKLILTADSTNHWWNIRLRANATSTGKLKHRRTNCCPP